MTINEIVPVAVGVLGLSTLASIAIEARTLQKEKFSASYVSTLTYIAIKNPVRASSLAHVVNLAKAYFSNPMHIFSLITALSGDGGRLLTENTAAFALTLGLWHIATNTLILKGKTKPLTNGIKKIRTGISSILHH